MEDIEAYLFKVVRRPYWRTELLSGITVAFALIPEALAYSILAGLSPLTGVYTSFVIGLSVTLLGTRPGMISGVTGAVAVIMVSPGHSDGAEYVYTIVVLAGVLQVIAGLLRAGRLTFFLTPPVMIGFMNGLAILLFLSQMAQFRYPDAAGMAHWLSLKKLWLPLLLTMSSVAIVVVFPRFIKVIPSSLVAILLITMFVWWLHLPVKRVGDIAFIHGRLPVWHVPMVLFSWDTFTSVLPYSVALAAVGSVESLLALTALDTLEGTRSPATKELLVQGIGNVIAGFFAGMGGCAMTVESRLNYASGGRGRLSGFITALMLMVFILIAGRIAEQIPMAALSGVMIVVAMNSFQWEGIWKICKIGVGEVIIMGGVTAISVFGNLAMGVMSGILITIVLGKLR
jgi:SulP family sulfate permease